MRDVSLFSGSAGYCTAGQTTPRMKSTSPTRSPQAFERGRPAELALERHNPGPTRTGGVSPAERDAARAIDEAMRQRAAATKAALASRSSSRNETTNGAVQPELYGIVVYELGLLSGENTPNGRAAISAAQRLDDQLKQDGAAALNACRQLNNELDAVAQLRGYP